MSARYVVLHLNEDRSKCKSALLIKVIGPSPDGRLVVNVVNTDDITGHGEIKQLPDVSRQYMCTPDQLSVLIEDVVTPWLVAKAREPRMYVSVSTHKQKVGLGTFTQPIDKLPCVLLEGLVPVLNRCVRLLMQFDSLQNTSAHGDHCIF